MKLAVSNIAWQTHDDPKIFNMLKGNGVNGIEVAPTKIWGRWELATPKKAATYRQQIAVQGFEIPAMQALLFDKPELQLFDSSIAGPFLSHISLLANLAEAMGAKVLVLGSPKNRKRGQLSMEASLEIASEILFKAAEICSKHNCCIGLEPNPVEYGCDFINNVADARALIDMVNHNGLQLHLDAAGIHMCGGDISDIIRQAGSFVHYHISEPMLEPIENGMVDHFSALQTLKEAQYDGWVSIEMKQPEDVMKLERSVRTCTKILRCI